MLLRCGDGVPTNNTSRSFSAAGAGRKRDGKCGQTVQHLTGTDSFTLETSGTAVLDKYFGAGFNWYDATRHISDANDLNLLSLTATSVTVTEEGAESYTLTTANALSTLTGAGTMPLEGLTDQTGAQGYTVTTESTFSVTNSGGSSFPLLRAGDVRGRLRLQ